MNPQQPAAEPFLVRDARKDDLPSVLALLRSTGLPSDGVTDQFPDAYAIACRVATSELVAAGGVESYGKSGLLRSICVAPSCAGQGLGTRITRVLLARAGDKGLETVFLLTATAPHFFVRLGFEEVQRAEAPEAIQGSSQFRSICPESAKCLTWVGFSASFSPEARLWR